MIMKIGKLAAVAAVAMMASGCATVIRGTSQDYAITSTPSGATVTSTIGFECVTPCALKLKRKDGFTATIALPGYATATAVVESRFNGGAAVAGNAIFGGIIGAGVDASNGSLNTLSPSPLHVDLVAVGASAAQADATAMAAPAADTAATAADAAATAADAAAPAAEAAAVTPPQAQ